MPISFINKGGIKIYNLSTGKTQPQQQEEAQKGKSLRYDNEYRRRIELIQDLEFPSSSNKICLSNDENFLAVTGTYKPRVKLFELSQLCLKFERHFDSEITDFKILSDDQTKMVFLRNDRTLEFHARYGIHHKTRIPKNGRDMVYHKQSCDLLLTSDSNLMYRLNLDQGRFLAPLETSLNNINCSALNDHLELLAIGGSDGRIEFYDRRISNKSNNVENNFVASLDTLSHSHDHSFDITSMKFSEDNMLQFSVGCLNGALMFYDLRSSNPVWIADHRYRLPIKSLRFSQNGLSQNRSDSSSKFLFSMDSKIVKVWNVDTGKLFTSIQPNSNIKLNDLCLIPNSGLLFAAANHTRVQSFYLPSIGIAPKQCSFIENITEELEEEENNSQVDSSLNQLGDSLANLNTNNSIYDDQKFVTEQDLNRIGAKDLLMHSKNKSGESTIIRPYMHGYFIDNRLQNRLNRISEDTIDEKATQQNYLKRRAEAKMARLSKDRITVRRKLPKVNRALAEDLIKENEKKQLKHNQRKNTQQLQEKTSQDVEKTLIEGSKPDLLSDERFKSMFTNPDFQIDIYSNEYQLLHPTMSEALNKKSSAQSSDNEELELDESDLSDVESDKRRARAGRIQLEMLRTGESEKYLSNTNIPEIDINKLQESQEIGEEKPVKNLALEQTQNKILKQFKASNNDKIRMYTLKPGADLPQSSSSNLDGDDNSKIDFINQGSSQHKTLEMQLRDKLDLSFKPLENTSEKQNDRKNNFQHKNKLKSHRKRRKARF